MYLKGKFIQWCFSYLKKKSCFLQVWDRIKTCPTSLSNARVLKLLYHKTLGLKRKQNRAQSSETPSLGTHFKSYEGQELSPHSLSCGRGTQLPYLTWTLGDPASLPSGSKATTPSQCKGFWKDEKSQRLMNCLFSDCSPSGSLTV